MFAKIGQMWYLYVEPLIKLLISKISLCATSRFVHGQKRLCYFVYFGIALLQLLLFTFINNKIVFKLLKWTGAVMQDHDQYSAASFYEPIGL